jgi:hypothetical protein
MAKNTATCGKTTVTYDERCGYVCNCIPGKPCDWTVSCPDGKGGWIDTTGTGLVVNLPTNPPTVTVAGRLALCAKALEKTWKRRVIVPVGLGTKTIRTRTLKGTPEQIAEALGLKLGSRRTTGR